MKWMNQFGSGWLNKKLPLNQSNDVSFSPQDQKRCAASTTKRCRRRSRWTWWRSRKRCSAQQLGKGSGCESFQCWVNLVVRYYLTSIPLFCESNIWYNTELGHHMYHHILLWQCDNDKKLIFSNHWALGTVAQYWCQTKVWLKSPAVLPGSYGWSFTGIYP